MGTARTIALASLLALGVCASPASAEPLSMTFTEARANVGVQLSDAALFEAPDTAQLEAQVGPGGEGITAGNLAVPAFSTHITDPIDADVTVEFENGTITGIFAQATGALTLSIPTGGTLTANGKSCIVSTTPAALTLSTEGSSGGASPRSGAPFTAGLTGAGAIAGQWTDMDATPVNPSPGGDSVFCADVAQQIGGPGGIWLEREGDVVPPPAPQLSGTDPGGEDGGPTPIPACIVPKLAGKTLARAKAALKAAGCKLGKVTKPKWLKGKRRVLVVKSSNPRAGARPANGKVHLKLRPKG